jgi:predicted MFS family arabinose efflux permease
LTKVNIPEGFGGLLAPERGFWRMGSRAAGQTLGAPQSLVSPRVTLGLLLAIYALNFTDRQLVAVLSEPIKHELGLSDAQVGLLYGLAFAVVYSFAGIPMARWADRGDRARVINVSLLVFSAMTVACGLAVTYAQLLLARVGVALGEGGTNPASHSLIADLYPEARRGSAMAVFALGPSAGILLGFIFGGVIGQAWGWRGALVAAGLAGLGLAMLTSWALKDLPRTAARDDSGLHGLRQLFVHASMRNIFIGGALASVAAYAAIGWLPAFLIRSHGMGTAAAGTVLGLLLGALGAVGTLGGGVLADRLGARNRAWRLRFVAVAFLAVAPMWPIALLVSHPVAAIATLAIPAAVLCAYLAPTFAAVQSLAPPGMRALAAALLLMVGSLVGLGLGPLLVGALSDALRPAHGADSLRLALLVVVPVYLWSAAHYFAASRTLAADLDSR